MAIQLGLLSIERVIIHDVPRKTRARGGGNLILSEIESPLDQDLRVFMREKIIQSAGASSAFKVVFNEQTPSPIPQLVQSHLTGDGADFVEISKLMAHHLHATQSGVNPGGLFCVVDCAFGGYRGICLLKLEREEGVRLETLDIDGRQTFNMEHVKDIMFTAKTRLYKLGLFSYDEALTPPIEGLVCDEQRGFHPRLEIAQFFLRNFLGCDLATAPRIATKRFFESTQSYINECVTDPLLKAEYMNHLLSELTNQNPTLSIVGFANAYLPPDERQRYLAHAAQGAVTMGAFNKDLDLLPHIRRLVMEFTNGVQVIAPHSALDQHVRLSRLEDGRTRVEVLDELRQVRTK